MKVINQYTAAIVQAGSEVLDNDKGIEHRSLSA
ncbi:hypothetical protein SAMN05216238_101352 [Lentibacillus persicus]|uniref:Uncharacterized protein n=1 Tax=Lentibacillus persicus TaxID=640948 RepID=A0A1I1SC98_9BACI|nr:hypothetical protein SAMN05216238_101352 [Lentibacillus persicus]